MKKSEWFPKTSCTWLGFFWNFENATVSVSAERVSKLFKKLYKFKKSPCMTTKVVDSIVGSVVSMKLILRDRAVFFNPFLTDSSELQRGKELSLDKNSGFQYP